MATKTQSTDRTSLLASVTNATIAASKSDDTLKAAVIAAGGDQSDVADAYRIGRYLRDRFPSATKTTKAMMAAANSWRTAKASERSEADQAFYKTVNVAWGRLLKGWGIESTHVRAGNTNAKGKAAKGKGKASKAKVATLPTAKSPASAAEYFRLQCSAWQAYAEKNAKQFTPEQLAAITSAVDLVRAAFPNSK
jgi:hypothetical protein